MGRGLSDYNVLSTGLGILGGMVAGPAGAAAGSTLGGLAEGDDFGEAMMSGMLSFGVGTALQGLGDVAKVGMTTGGAEGDILKTAAGKELGKDALGRQVAEKVGYSGITDNSFNALYPSTGDTVFDKIGGAVGKGKFADYGQFASTAIKNPKVYTGLGMAGLGLAGQMEPPTLEDPEKKTYARRPNLTTGPARAQNAPGANFAPGYDPEFDYGFAEGGIVPMDRIADMGLSIKRVGPAPQQGGGGIIPMDDLLSRSDLFKRVGPAPQRRDGGILDMGALIQANPNMFNRVTEDEDEDRRFAGGGIVSGNRKYANGNLIDRVVNTNPQNPGEIVQNVGTGLSAVNALSNIGAPGLGTAVGAVGQGLAADAYQDALARQGITTEWNAPGESERDNRNFISGPEAMLGGATFGLLGNTADDQYKEIQNRARALSGPEVGMARTHRPLTFTQAAKTLADDPSRSPVTTGNLSPTLDNINDDDDNQDDGSSVTIDLDSVANAPSLNDNPFGLDANEENLASLMAGTGNAFNTVAGSVEGYNDIDPAVQNAISGMQRDIAVADVVPQSFTDAELGPTSWANVSPQALADPGLGEGGMGSSWAQGGLVPGSMNQPQKKYFGIYKKGGPVRSYALGENVDAIEEEQVQQNPIVVEAVAAITGNHPNPEAAIMQFVKIYGEEAFVALREEIIAEASSEERQASGLGALSGPGTGLSDDIPAEVQQGGLTEPAALSVGEQVVPADVVAMLGEGSTEAGSKKIDGMVDEVRMQKTGTKRQAGPLDMDRVSAMVA